MAMNQDEAMRALDDAEVVPCLTAPIGEAKELLAACLEDDIPALLDRGDCCDTGGCAPKVELLVRPDDVPRVAALLRTRWHGMLEREGTVESWGAGADPEAEPPCPACGHVGPLDAGACGGCGLQLG
jgi:hypothetical protein